MATKNGSYNDWLNRKTTSIEHKEFIFQLARPNEGQTLKNGDGSYPAFPPKSRLRLGDEQIMYSEGGAPAIQTTIAYIPGVNSIFKKKHTEEQIKGAKVINLLFKHGILRVMGYDTELLDFLMLSNYNGTNEKRNKTKVRDPFYILQDIEKYVNEETSKDEELQDALYFCRKGDWKTVRAYARVLNIPVDEYESQAELRLILRPIAEADPVKFNAGIKDPKTNLKYITLIAIKAGILVHNKQSNSIAWAINPTNPLSVAGMGKNVIDVFVNALQTDEGKVVLEEIESLLNPDKPKIKEESKMFVPSADEKKNNKVSSGLFAPLETDEVLNEMIDKLIDAGVITKKHPANHYYKDQHFSNKAKLLHEIKNNEVAYNVMKADFERVETMA